MFPQAHLFMTLSNMMSVPIEPKMLGLSFSGTSRHQSVRQPFESEMILKPE